MKENEFVKWIKNQKNSTLFLMSFQLAISLSILSIIGINIGLPKILMWGLSYTIFGSMICLLCSIKLKDFGFKFLFSLTGFLHLFGAGVVVYLLTITGLRMMGLLI